MKVVGIIFAVACLTVCTSGFHTKFLPCKGDAVESASTTFVDLSPCSSQPCNLKRGSTYELSINFETGAAPASIPAITTHLYAIIASIHVPFPGFNMTNGCVKSGLACPLAPNRAYTYVIPIYVNPKTTIDIETVVEARLVDDTTKKDLLCNLMQVKVVG